MNEILQQITQLTQNIGKLDTFYNKYNKSNLEQTVQERDTELMWHFFN